ncbi:hypothetical protein BDN67DRAFT_877520, partial [Paxillus ammoniavirescens]
LPDNPFFLQKDNSCLFNHLPPELLSRIFEVGASGNGYEEEDEMIAQSWNETHANCLEEKNEESMGTTANDDIDMTDEEDTNEEASSVRVMTGSSDTSPPWPPFQIVVSHVCRRWRSVAFSTPSLWTYIDVSPEARPPYEHVSTLLERSKSLPIDIFIDCEPDEDSVSKDEDRPSVADVKSLFALLVPHVRRWRSMHVETSSYEHMYAFLTAVSDPSISPASQLRTLRLYHCDEEEEFSSFANPELSKHFTLFGGSAPCLRWLALSGVHVDWSQGWLASASASNLTVLELAYHTEDVRPSWTAFATILRGAPALETLILCLSGPSGDLAQWVIEPNSAHTGGDLNAPIQLLKLTDLELALHSPTYASGLLRKLYIPALKGLTLNFEDGDYTEFINHLIEPATTVDPLPAHEQPRNLLSGLESLKIFGLPCAYQGVRTLYSELESLVTLNVSMSYLSDAFLDLLCNPRRIPLTEHNFIQLPRLTTLCVSGTSGDRIREVVRHRRAAGFPLKSIYVEESCDVDDDDVEWIKDNVETFEFFERSDGE